MRTMHMPTMHVPGCRQFASVYQLKRCQFRPVNRQRRLHCSADGFSRADQLESSAVTNTPDSWERLSSAKRQMKQAVAEENFALAAKLRDEIKVLADELPPIQQYLVHNVDILRNGSPDEKLQALNALAEAGDNMVVAEVAACLQDPTLQVAAADAMWSIFLRSKNPTVNELMREGLEKMQIGRYEDAVKVFDEIIKLEPTYAEGYNKRATVLYQLGRQQDSIRDCEAVLKLQPYHFGAASGMGLCYYSQRNWQQAIRSFDLALSIHPGLSQIKQYHEALRKEMEKERNS